MREVLTVIIVLLIVAVVLDGLRRMRNSRRNSIRMSAKVNHQEVAAEDDINDFGSELPSGGARVVNVRKAKDAVERNEEIKQRAEHKRRNQLKSFRIPEQVSLNLDQQVPTLMEPVEDSSSQSVESNFEADDVNEPSFEEHAYEESQFEASAEINDDGRIEPIFATDDSPRDLFEEEIVPEKPETTYPKETVETKRAEAKPVERKQPETKRQEPVSQPDEDLDFRDPELVLVINVMAPKEQPFDGAELLEIVLSQGMRFGTMNIFHRHEQDDGDGEMLYSMANIVVPGTFELAKMKSFTTPGVSFFMTLPMDANASEAFEEMLTTAKIISARMGGELKDENRSVLTPQTITHYRSKLQEFARKQLSRAPA